MDIDISYKLRAFKDSKSKDYAEALKIYHDSVDPALRTDTDEITYWINNYNKTFDDQFFILGFYENGKVIGFAEMVYFKREKIIVIDYLAIEKKYRGNDNFYSFIGCLKAFIKKNRLDYNYVVTEIGYLSSDLQPSTRSAALIRQLKVQNFGVIKAKYFQPRLGDVNRESDMQAFLLVYENSPIKEIKRETFLQIVDTIYYKHYLRWYRDIDSQYTTDIEEYKKELDKTFLKISKSIGQKKTIQINGYRFEEAEIKDPPEKSNWIGLVSSLALVILLFIIFIFVQIILKVNTPSLIILFLLSLITMLGLLSIFMKSKEAERIFDKLFGFFKRFSSKPR
jgi:hypothetical protein